MPYVRPEITDFAGRVGEAFRLDLGGGQALALELVAVRDRGRTVAGGSDRSGCALLFRGPGEKRLAPPRIDALDHAALGRIGIFLVPRGPDALGMTARHDRSA